MIEYLKISGIIDARKYGHKDDYDVLAPDGGPCAVYNMNNHTWLSCLHTDDDESGQWMGRQDH